MSLKEKGKSMKRVLWAGLVVLAAASLPSCGQYESCDPGQVKQFNVCFPGLVDGSAPDLATGGGGGMCRPAIAPDAAEDICTEKAAGFGENCMANSDCRCGKDLCAIIPGQTCGFCTRSNCLPDPSICPAGWVCYDATAWQPGYSLCVRP